MWVTGLLQCRGCVGRSRIFLCDFSVLVSKICLSPLWLICACCRVSLQRIDVSEPSASEALAGPFVTLYHRLCLPLSFACTHREQAGRIRPFCGVLLQRKCDKRVERGRPFPRGSEGWWLAGRDLVQRRHGVHVKPRRPSLR